MRTFSMTLMLLLGFLAFTACDADSIEHTSKADGDDGVIIEGPIEPDDKNEDGLPDLPL